MLVIDILSLFPGYFAGPFDESMIARARKKGLLEIRHTDLRNFAVTKHRKVDDRPFGGGPGMVMMVEPIVSAIQSVRKEKSHVVYLSPQGKQLTAELCAKLAEKEHLVLLCGHYEGVDERVMDEVDEEISIGDYVLTNGALAAIVVVDAVARFVPGVLGDERGALEDSFQNGILDCPHYTQPVDFAGKKVPEILFSGNHAEIKKWRQNEAEKRTKEKRPDLYVSHLQADECGKMGITLPVDDVGKAAKFYEKVLGIKLRLVSGKKAEGVVLTLEVEDFEKVERQIKRECPEAKCLGLELVFTDPYGYAWVVRKVRSYKEVKNEFND